MHWYMSPINLQQFNSARGGKPEHALNMTLHMYRNWICSSSDSPEGDTKIIIIYTYARGVGIII